MDALQELHDELYRAQRTESVEVLMGSIGKARLLLAQYRAALPSQPATAVQPVARVNSEGFLVECGDLLLSPGMLLFSAPAESGWQPIATAPKTSAAILVWCPENKNIFSVYWHPQRGWEHFGGASRPLYEEPARWQPLPPPPASEEKAAPSAAQPGGADGGA